VADCASHFLAAPTGLRRKAQGCPGLSGLPWVNGFPVINPNGVAALGCPDAGNRNPVWVVIFSRRLTQGGSFLATLGFEPESLWDSSQTRLHESICVLRLKLLDFPLLSFPIVG